MITGQWFICNSSQNVQQSFELVIASIWNDEYISLSVSFIDPNKKLFHIIQENSEEMTTDPIFEIDIADVSYFYWFKKTTELAVEPEPYNPFTFSLAKSYNEGDRYPTSLMDDSKGKIWT